MRRGKARLNVDLPQSARQRLEPALQRGDWTATWQGGHLEVRGNALEDAARLVLTEPECRNLRIAESSLEEVFSHIADQDRSAA